MGPTPNVLMYLFNYKLCGKGYSLNSELVLV